MNIEYRESGSADCPLIRIYGTSAAEFSLLHEAAQKLANGSADSIEIEKLKGFQALDDCSLTLVANDRDEGVTKLIKEQQDKFDLNLTRSKWGVVAGLIEPFTKSPLGSYHQWLCGKESIGDLSKSTIAIVISSHKDGTW
jgi:hypothetical protein